MGRLVLGASGRYVAVPHGAGGSSSTGLALDAQVLPYGGALAQPIDSAITRVEVKYRTAAGVDGTVAAVVRPEFGIARRTFGIDSIHADPAYALQLAGLWATIAGNEGTVPRLGALTYDSNRAGGFASAAHATALLSGYERSTEWFLGRAWPTRLGVRPVFGIIGGTIAYERGRWELGLQPAPVSQTGPGSRPLWIAGGSVAGVTIADIDPSVTFGDLAHIDTGPGLTLETQVRR